MAFERLEYGKDWRNAADFPTYEDSEAQVRADLQYHPDAVKEFINQLLDALEDGSAAASIGAGGGSLQDAFNTLAQRVGEAEDDIRAVAGGGVPAVSQCVRLPFLASSWVQTAGGVKLTIPETLHKRPRSAYGYALWDGELSATWHTAATQVSRDAGTGAITLSAPEPYDGAVAFFGL